MRVLRSALLAAFWLLAAACQPAPPPDPALWRIADADSEIWLFGSVHVLSPQLNWRSERVNAAFAAAEEFVTETEIGPESEYAALAARYGALPPGQTLSGRIGPEQAARLARTARSLGIDPAALESQRPWLTALQLSYAALAQAGQNPDAGVEAVLSAEARAQGKSLSYLETPEQQVRVLADLPPEEEERFLSITLREIEQGDASARNMDRAWVSGDTAALQRQLDEQWAEAGPVFHAALIVDRNRAWADEIEQRLAGSGRIFIAVGAAHLLGDDSVVAMLRARGIDVEGP